MNQKLFVKISNIIGVISIVLLIYWVFIYTAVNVFEFKIFKEDITDTFMVSVLGILALMFGSLMLNMMFNLTRIAERDKEKLHPKSKPISWKWGIVVGCSFPIIFGLLYLGDFLSTQKREEMLIASALSIVQNNPKKMEELANYSFERTWIGNAKTILELFAKTDENFPHVSLIVPDSIDGTKVYLRFNSYYSSATDSIYHLAKNDFIESTSKEEREYLKKVFFSNHKKIMFKANKWGVNELFYPYSDNGHRVVLFFTEYKKHGKFGS